MTSAEVIMMGPLSESSFLRVSITNYTVIPCGNGVLHVLSVGLASSSSRCRSTLTN